MSDFDINFPLKNTRTHEVEGASAHAFAFSLAGQLCGAAQNVPNQSVFWVREAWGGVQLNPLGITPYLDPQQLLIAQASSHVDALASAEEVLRSGSIKLVVVELNKPVGLTQGRRLQLAAQEGHAMGLCILPEGMGSHAAQSRWHCSPVFDDNAQTIDSTLQRWEIIKNKSGTLKAWNVKWDAKARRVSMVSQVSQR